MKGVQLSNDAMVVVADGKKALFLRNEGTASQVALVVEREMAQENPPTRELGSDRPGRKPGGDGVSRSSVGETDWHQRAEADFAARIATGLHGQLHGHFATEGDARPFPALVIVAPPKMLGDLRARLHPEVSRRIVAELDKDLTSHSVAEIARALGGPQDRRG